MKQNKNASRIREKQVKKDYAGTEASPYNEWVETRSTDGTNYTWSEPSQANPDILAEDQGLYYSQPTFSDERIEMIYKALPYLTDKQKMVLQLVGLEGKTLEHCGVIMGISRGNVLDILKRARKIIKSKSKNI